MATIKSRAQQEYEHYEQFNKQNMNKQEIINATKDAIVASGKKFNEIPKDSFLHFFEKEGIPKNMWESIYTELSESYQPKKKKEEAREDIKTNHKVDYYSNAHNDVKKREPRKSIFGEIQKIAG